jgi:hypothetical protein
MAMYGWIAIVLVVAAAAVIVVINLTSSTPRSGTEGRRAPRSLVNTVASVPAHVYDSVGTGGYPIAYTAITKVHGPALTGGGSSGSGSGGSGSHTTGKPEVFYYGAEWCPYCATFRWPFIQALSAFGTFHNLTLAKSSPTDVYPNTNTFSFAHSTYRSNYIYFNPLEVEDMARKTIATPTAAEQKILLRYDYIAQSQSTGFPFVDFGGKYLGQSFPATLTPQALQGLSWDQIAGQLDQPSSAIGHMNAATANYYKAVICKIDGGKPGSVCTSAGVVAADKELAKAPVAKVTGP